MSACLPILLLEVFISYLFCMPQVLADEYGLKLKQNYCWAKYHELILQKVFFEVSYKVSYMCIEPNEDQGYHQGKFSKTFLSCILMASYCFQNYFFCDFKFTSKSVYEILLLKKTLLKIFVLSFIANILIFSNLPEKLNLPSKVVQNQVSSQIMVHVRNLTQVKYWRHNCLKMKFFGAADISAMLWCPERLAQAPAKVAEGFSARTSLESVFISTK